MTPAALFVAVSLAVPTPMQLVEADAYVRNPDIPAVVTDRDRAALIAVGRRLELIEPNELFWLPDSDGVYGEPDAPTLLLLLRDRFADLHEAPPLADSLRLPPPAACWDAASFNGRGADHFRERALWEPDRETALLAAAAECEAYRDFWRTAAAAGGGYQGVADRRRCLAELREAVGRAAWSLGRLPEFVPAHLFHAR